jgi:acyl carrier protein
LSASSELNQRIKRALIEELDLRGKTEADIDDAAPLFGEGLGLDSLDALQLAMAIEERFGVAVPEGEAGRAIFASPPPLARQRRGRGSCGLRASR